MSGRTQDILNLRIALILPPLKFFISTIFVAESAVQQEPVQFNTPEPFKQDEASANADNTISDDKLENSETSDVKSTLWQTLNDRTSTSQKPPKSSQQPQPTATDRMDMDYQDVNYIIQKNVFRPNLVPSIPDPRYGGVTDINAQLTPQIQSRNGNR